MHMNYRGAFLCWVRLTRAPRSPFPGSWHGRTSPGSGPAGEPTAWMRGCPRSLAGRLPHHPYPHPQNKERTPNPWPPCGDLARGRVGYCEIKREEGYRERAPRQRRLRGGAAGPGQVRGVCLPARRSPHKVSLLRKGKPGSWGGDEEGAHGAPVRSAPALGRRDREAARGGRGGRGPSGRRAGTGGRGPGRAARS